MKKFKENPVNAFSGSGKQTHEDAEMPKLTNEIKQLKAEIKFLKKHGVFCIGPTGKYTTIKK